MINHIVSFGETLSEIATKYDMSMNEILRINPQIKNPDTLHSGQDINVHPKEYEPPIDTGLYCLSCNPAVHWLELRFKSESNKGIAGLNVSIMDAYAGESTQQTDSNGMVRFDKVALGAVSVWVEQKHLLSTVEQYASRDKTELPDSAIKAEAQTNQHHYRYASVADLWDTPPEDEFLIKHQPQQFKTRGKKGYGMQVPVNQTIVFEIKAVRSLVPYLLDTDNYNLVTAYNMCLLTMLSYADYIKDYRPSVNDDFEQFILSSNEDTGYVNDVLASWRAGKQHNSVNNVSLDTNENFLMKEVPYSSHLKGQAFVAKAEGDGLFSINESSEIFVLYNHETIIVVMRGSQEGEDWLRDLKASQTNISLAGDKLDSSAYYAHSGFYDYLTPVKEQLYDFIEKMLKDGIFRDIYVAGHSLGGAAACLFSVFLSERPSIMSLTKQFRLFTYGEPRSLNDNAILQKRELLHYRHINFLDMVPLVPLRGMGFYHHGRLIQLYNYTRDEQVIVLPEQSGVDTFAQTLDIDTVHHDTYQYIDDLVGFSGMQHMSGDYCESLLTHFRYYSDNETNQAQRYQEVIDRLDKINVGAYNRALAILKGAEPSSRVTSDVMIFGGVDDTEMKERVKQQMRLSSAVKGE